MDLLERRVGDGARAYREDRPARRRTSPRVGHRVLPVALVLASPAAASLGHSRGRCSTCSSWPSRPPPPRLSRCSASCSTRARTTRRVRRRARARPRRRRPGAPRRARRALRDGTATVSLGARHVGARGGCVALFVAQALVSLVVPAPRAAVRGVLGAVPRTAALGRVAGEVDQRLDGEERPDGHGEARADRRLQNALARRRAAGRRERSRRLARHAHVHRADDAEVVVEADGRRGHADDDQPGPAAVVRRREDVELADEAAGQREAGEAEHEDARATAEERPLPAAARPGCRASPAR